MPLVECQFHSEALGLRTTSNVILPHPTKRTGGRGPYPTLYLLHGLTGDHTCWLRQIPIERYVEPFNLAVVTCDGHRSRYTDMAIGWRYGTYLTEELPFIARSLFPLSPARKDNFVAGASMGGYGAFKWALRKPEMFAAAASLSGAFRIASGMDPRMADPARRREFRGIFGALGKLRGSEHDLFALSRRAARKKLRLPALYQCCGTEDHLLEINRRFFEQGRKLGLPLTYEESPGGHEWNYWDRQIRRVLEWLPLSRRSSGANR